LVISASLAACLVGGVTLRAEEQPPAPATIDVGDLWRDFRNRGDKPEETSPATEQREERRFLVVAPTIGSKPATGLTGGLNSNMAFFRGDPKTTRISTMPKPGVLAPTSTYSVSLCMNWGTLWDSPTRMIRPP